MTRRQSNLTTFRAATPTSPDQANFYTNFRFSHLPQRTVRPTKLGCADSWTTPNASGGPAVSKNARTGLPLGGGDDFQWPRNDPGALKV